MTREEAIKFLKSGCLTLACEYHVKNRCNADYREKEAKKDEALKMAIESLGNDTNVGSKWIPCSERLPECAWGYETDSVLFQLKSGSIEVGCYGTGGKYRDRYFRTYRDVFEGFDVKDIIAWQPLPEPYKEGDT